MRGRTRSRQATTSAFPYRGESRHPEIGKLPWEVVAQPSGEQGLPCGPELYAHTSEVTILCLFLCLPGAFTLSRCSDSCHKWLH